MTRILTLHLDDDVFLALKEAKGSYTWTQFVVAKCLGEQLRDKNAIAATKGQAGASLAPAASRSTHTPTQEGSLGTNPSSTDPGTQGQEKADP